jgi:hypothetical protein
MKKTILHSMPLIIICLFCENALAALLNEYWIQGTAAALQTPTTAQINKIGSGALLTIPSAISGTGAWVQVPVPIPALQASIRTNLTKVMVQFTGTGKISQVDVWDGRKKIASQAVNWSGDSVKQVSIPSVPLLNSGVNVSLRVTNTCKVGTVCPMQTMKIVSVGGAFYK